MAGRVVLHLGAMKTGTSYLQSVIGENHTAIEAAGFTFLGGKFGVQARAVRDVLNLPKAPHKNRRRWAELAREAQRLDGRTGIVSMEFLSFAQQRHVDAFLEPLAGLEVEVVMTVRDQFRVIPAQWQTYTRNYGTDDWGSYLRNIEPSRLRRRHDSRAHMTFHRAQGVLTALERWSAAPNVVRTHVITVPPSGAPRDELWHRFRAATAMPDVPLDVVDVYDNTSLGFGSADFLRRANAHLQDVRPKRYRSGIALMARGVLADRRSRESKPALDLKAAKFARTRNEQLRAGIDAHGYSLWGSLDDLPVPGDLSAYPRKAVAPSEQEVIGAAQAVWAHLAEKEGRAGTAPTRLDDAVFEATAMLRAIKGWDDSSS